MIPFPGNNFAYKRIAGTNPAANAEVSEAVPAGLYWLLLAVQVALAQGATQTPQPILVIDDGANVIAEFPGSSAAQVAASTCAYTWAPDMPLLAQIGATPNIRSGGPLSGSLILGAGYRVRTVTLGIGANSDYGAPSLYVVEFK